MGPSSGEKAAGARAAEFAGYLQGNAKAIFGKDDQVFARLNDAYGKTIAQGYQQNGFSQAEYNELVSGVVTRGAAAARAEQAAGRAAFAGFGGGNVPTASGAAGSVLAGISQKSMEDIQERLQNVDITNKELGMQHYERALEGLAKAPAEVYSNVPGISGQVTEANKTDFENQQQMAAQNPVNAIVGDVIGAGLGFASGGLSNIAAGKTFLGKATGG